ncbi:polycystin-1 [Trichomycterus rosablanca]|uniref:polycystin-1 n=1 Tax=Trichomycterus rosablanca TaxID=2290929 RepID=UPI002F35BE40
MAFILRLPLILILSAVIHCSTDEESCPNGAQIDQDHFHCYWMPASALTWPEAKDVCQEIKGGDLAIVDKPGLQKFLGNAFQLEISLLVWMRNRNDTGPDQHSGFGSARSSPEDLKHATCSTMTLGLGQWLNSTCDQKHRFICGRKISVSLPLLDSYVIGVPLMSARFTQSQLQPLPSLPDVQQKVEMMMFPGLWFSHGGRVLSVDLVTQPSQQLTMAKVQILRPYCSPNYHLVPPGCSFLLNPFSCCSQKPLCNTTGGCPTGQYWCHLLESCLSVTSPCSPYHLFPGGHVFTLPPRYPALAPFYHVVTDIALEIPSASEPVHLTVPLKEKNILVYPDDIVAVQHTRNSEGFLHCVSGSDSGWRQSYRSLSGPEWGGWVDAILSAQADRARWVDGVVCDLRLIHQDNVNVFDVSPQTEIYNVAVTTTSTTLSKASTPVSGMQLVYPVLSKENEIHLPVNIQTPIILKILSGRNAMSTWSAPVSKTDVPFLPSCTAEVPDIHRVCERVTDDTWCSYVYFMPTSQGEQSLNITASNKLNSQTMSVKVQSHIIITGLSVRPQGFYRVLVDIPQMFTALVASGSSVKYTWLIANPFQFAHTGETYSILFRKPGKYIIKVKAENPVSSQIFELKLEADAMIPLADLTLLAEPEAIAVNTLNIYNLKVKLDVSIGVKIRWDFGDGSVCVSHTVPAPLDRNDNSMDQTATQVYLKDSAHHTYTTQGDYSLSIQVQNEYDVIEKAALTKVRVPLTKLLVSLVPTVPKVNQKILLEASSLPSSYGVHYTWRFGDGTLEIKGPHNSISHTFKEAGVYNVSVCSNNTLSKLVTWMEVEVFETISGLRVWNNGPNELNTVTEITGRVATGTSLSWTFELGDGTVFTELSKSLILHTYKSTGNFTVQVTVSNAVSRVTQLINIEIYQLAIIGILPSDCITSGQEINLQALVKGNVSELTFHWWFGDGTATSIKKGMSTIVHTFSDSGNYSTDVTIYSLTGSASYHTSVCVEALITDLNLHSASNVVAIGEKICFDVSVIPAGGETYQFLWYVSSFSDPPVNGMSKKCFVFSEEGTQEVVVIAQNRVSQKTAKLTIFVQRPVTNLYIRHSGNLNVFTYNQTYYFWTEPSHSNVIVEWDFGDGSAKKEGRNISHVFTSAGQYHVTALVFNAVSKEVVSVQVEVQVPISSLVIQTKPFAEAGQDTLITAISNVIDVQFYWKVNSYPPSQLGTSQYRYVFPKAGIFEVSVTAQNLVSEINASTLIEVVERIQGVQITSQSLKSLRYFPTNETVTLTASVKHGTRLTYRWLAQQHGVKTTTEDGKHFKLLTCISGDVFVKLTVANVLGEVQSEVSLRAIERISAVNISSPVNVISKGQPVNISLYLPTGSDLEYIWFSDLDRSPVTSDVPYLSHVFNTVGIFNLSVSVKNIFSSAHTTIQFTVQEPVSEIDFKVDGKLNPFIVPSNQLLQFQGSAQTGTVRYWKWTLDVQEGNDIVIGKNQAVSYSFLDEGDYRVTLAASNDVSWQVVSHIVTVQNVIKGLSLRVSHSVICENEPITFKPSISQGSGVTFLLEFPEGNTSLKVQKEFTTSFLPVGNHTVKVVARNHVSIIAATVSVQVVERIRGLHLINCCAEVLEASKLTNFGASVDTISQVTYHWSFFQDGFNTSHQVGQSVNYTPISNGSLSVTVNASTNVCSQSLTKTVFVQWPVKNIKLVVSSAELFVDHPITFVVLTDNCCDLTYKWEFGDSNKIWLTKSNQANHTYSIEGKFMMQVTVFNNVSKISEWFPIVVKKLQCLQPQVSLIQDQSSLQIFKSRPNYFEARVNLNGCTFYKTKYLWEIFHDLNCTERKVSLNGLIDLTMPLLSLPKHSLDVGDYCLKFTTRFHGTPLQHNKTTRFSVVNNPLVPLIKGGSYRLWSSQKDLILDGTESYDPDATVQEKEPLTFQWNILLIKVYDTEVLPVTVKCVSCSLLTSFYISHSHPVALAGRCLYCNGTVQYKWTTMNNRGTVLHLNEITTSTGDHSPDLVIRPDVLTPGSEYILTLNVFQPTTGLWGSASITVKTSYPPQGGTCTQSPNDSVQLLQDKVSFNCTGWVDKDNHSAQMIYSLQVEQCEPSGPRCPLTVLYRGTQNTFSSLVPMGIARKELNASIITVIVMVEDNMGAKVTALRRNLVVKLSLNNQNTTAWLKEKSQSELWALLQQGNPQHVVQYSAALISHLNQLKDISMHEWKDKVQMRGNVTQALASFTVSSLQDAAQISFALAQSTAVPSEVQCGHCHIQVVESMKKMIKVIQDQTRQGDVTPTDTGRNILNVLAEVCSVLSKVNARKAAGPDGIPGRVLRACAEQLAQVFTNIYNLSLAQATVPTCWKTSIIIPVPKRTTAACLNDFRPVALTPIAMKCFEKLVLCHLKAALPPALDPYQFAYRANRSTEDAISTALHSALTHLDNNDTYIRMLFIDFSSAFNTVIPTKLVAKLSDLGISTPMCNWVLNFLTNRPQSVRLGSQVSSSLTLSTGVPQGCVLSPLLFSLFTHDCVPLHTSNTLIKFADDTTVVGRIKDNDESAYREEIQHLVAWCSSNNLHLNTDKTKELIVDFRKTKSCTHLPVLINGDEVERVSSFKFLGIHISEDLSWTHNTSCLVKKAQQRLYFLRRLKKDHLSPQILTNFYRCTIESVLSNCVTVWYGSSTVADRKALHKVVRTAQRIIGTQLPTIGDLHHQRCVRRAHSSTMAAVQKPINSSVLHNFYQNHSTSEAAASAFHQVRELMRALMWSRMPGEEALSLKAPQISVVGKRGNPTSDLLCTEQSSQCQFHIPSALSLQLRTVREDVLQILLVIEDEKNPFILAADPPISTTLAAMEFASPQGQPIPIANLTTKSAIRVTLHNRKMEGSRGVNVTLTSEGSLNFTIRAVKTDRQAGLFIAFTFNWIQGFGESISGKVSITVADHQDLPLSQHFLVQELTLSLSADIPSTEETVYLTPLLNGSVKDLYVSMNSSVNVKLEVSVCVFSSLCQFFNMKEGRWSTAGLSVLSSSRRNTAHCLTEHLTLFGASLFVYPDAVLLLPPSDGPVRNVVVGIVCGVLLLIHLLLGLIAHKLDHLEGLRLSCVSLCGQPGCYQYRVLVKTGWQRGAGTSAHVGISLYGLNKSGSRHLQREGAFQRNGLDDFHIETEANLGEIWKICIWHDNTGLDPSWYLQHVSVWDMQTDNIFFFIVDDWLSVENEMNCGMVQKVVLATCPQELQRFGKILCAQLVFGLREHHLWFSLWERPAHSRFSRAQRVTCCALILHLYLAAGAVWYGAVGTRNSRGAVADQMLMNAETILAGMTMAVLMFPFQSFLTFLFRNTKNKVDMELSLPPSPMSDTVEMDVYLNHPDISCSSFLSMPRDPESFSDEASSSLTESLDSPKLESEFWETLNIGFESKIGHWASTDSIFESLPEITGPTRLLKRKRALLQLRLTTPESGPPTREPSASSYLKEKPFLATDEELRPVSTDPYTSSAASTGPSTSDSGRYSPSEAFLFGSQESSSSEWMDLIEDKHDSEGGLYKSQSSLSVASLASTFLPSLPPDSFSTTSITRIGVPRREPGPMLPSWVLAVVYVHVVLLMGTCMALVGLYGSTFSSSVVLMWLISAFSAFLTSVLILEPLMISIRALYLAAIVKPVDPEVEDRLAQETVVKRTEEEMGDKVRPLCGYSLLQAREEARKVRKLQKLMKNCLIAMLFFLVVLMVNYQENIQEMNGRLLLPAVKHSIISTEPGKPDLTALSGWMGAWQWMYHSLTSHLHKNPSLTLLGLPRLQRTQSKNFCGENMKDPVKIGQSMMMTAPGLQSLKETHPSNSTSFFLFWPWNEGQSCVFTETEEVLLGNSTGSTSNILSSLQQARWITPETQSLLVEFTQYHRETGLFLPISILLKNTETQMLQSSIFIQTFHTPGSDIRLDLNVTLTALLLLFSLCFLSAETLTIVREKVQYFIQAQHLFQLFLAVISFMAASLRLYYFSLATSCLSSHITQPDTFTDFHSPAVLFKTSSQLSALLLMLLVLQMIGSVRFVRRWAVFGKVLQQMSPVLCGVAVLFLLLLLLFSHTGSLLFSGSVEGFVTVEKSLQSLLCLLRGRMVLHQLCKQHPMLGPLFCFSAFGLCFWLLSRICGAVLLQTYRTVRGEIYRPSLEPQDYEMVEFLIKRLKLWMGLSKIKEFRHRVKFEGMEPPPSRSSQCSRFSSSPTPVSPAAPRLVSSTSSSASESSVLSDSHEVQQYVDRLPPSVDNLLAGFDRVSQLTEDVYNIELQLQKVYSRIIQKRKTQREAQPKTFKKCSVSPELPDPKRQSQTSLTMCAPQVHPLRRAIHSESYILGSSTIPPTLFVVTKNSQIANPEIKNFPRRRAWHSGSCHSADTIQRCAKPQTPEDIPVRPRSEEGDLGKVSRRMPVKKRAWHPETSELENNSEESAL